MITKPTVLILGAGASAHCGYPLGGALLSRICALRGSVRLNDLPDCWTRDDAESFLTRLSRSGHYSIDAFLATEGVDSRLGKFLIAQEMKSHEEINNLFPPQDPGWYRYLFNALLGEGPPQFEKNRLCIITFNYDRSLEAYLHVALQNRFLLNEADAERILRQLPIIHVHGILGDYPRVSYSPKYTPAELVTISDNIRIIHEIQDRDGDFCNDMFKEANHFLKSAERVYFLGFGFHFENIRRFRFFTKENTQGKTIRGTSSGFGPLELQRLQRHFGEAGLTSSSLPGYLCGDFFAFVADLD